MKKGMVLIFCILLLLSSFGGNDTLDEISDDIGVDVTGGELVSLADTHGGFHGDGETVAKITMQEDLTAQIQENPRWQPLPLTSNLERAVYGACFEEGDIPRIATGFYYFEDRHAQSMDPSDDSELFSRGSFNFTMAIYDAENGVLYYLEFDT